MEKVCGISLQNLDFNLVEATLLSIETKTLTPIIKEELKLKIQSQRLAAGKQELPKPVFKEPEKCPLTVEEEKKRDYRRERNRIAAAKCRSKRKSETEHLKTVLAEEELKNYTLKRKLESLENEKEEMLKKLKVQGNFDVQWTSGEQPSSICPVEATGLSGSPSTSPSVASIDQYTTPVSPDPRQSPLPLSTPSSMPLPPSRYTPSSVSSPSPVPLPPSPVPQLIFDATPQPLKIHQLPLSVSSDQLQLFQPVPSLPPPKSVSSRSPVPSALQTGLNTFPSHMQLHEYDVNFEDLPSTSSGIYDNEKFQRRYSEDLPKNLGAQNYQTRRFSAESRVSDYQRKAKETIEMSNLDTRSPEETNMFDQNSVQTGQNTNICQVNMSYIIHDKDTDLSDEEFFRFENETLPFEKYQNLVQVTNSLPQVSTEDMVTTDGIKPSMPVAKTFEDFLEDPTTEKIDLEQSHVIDTCLLQLIPVFEDEAMVPECDREDSFHVPTGPASPTFY